MSSINNLDLNIVDNEITNLNEIMDLLSTGDVNEDTVSHFKTLMNRLVSMDIKNKSQLIDALSSKIMEYEATLQRNTDNQNALEVLKTTNEDFKKLNIISTKREDNDSDTYIDYLTYTDDDGKVMMLFCDTGTTISDFIEAHADKIPSMSAIDVFNHFKDYVHLEVEFLSIEEMENESDRKNRALVNDPEIVNNELEEVRSYKNTYGIIDDVEIAIDNKGERIYRIGTGIIKFKTVNEKRVMQVLKQPVLKQMSSYDELLLELDEEQEITPLKTEAVSTDVSVRSDSYASLEIIDEDSFKSERMDEIVARRDVYDLELTYEEEHELNLYVKYLLEHMKLVVEKKVPADDTTKILVNFMESNRGANPSIVDAYEELRDGNDDKTNLNDIEKEFASIYLECREKMKSLGLDNSLEKRRILENDDRPRAGITTIVLLLELITLAMFILMFLRLDI